MADRDVILKLSLKAIDAKPLTVLAATAKKTGADIGKGLSPKLNLHPQKLPAPVVVPLVPRTLKPQLAQPPGSGFSKPQPIALKVRSLAKKPAADNSPYGEQIAGLKRWQEALAAVGKELDAEQAKLDKLNAARTPENLRRKAGLGNLRDKALGKEAPELLPGNEKARVLSEARKHAQQENRKDKILGRKAPDVLPGNDKAKKALVAGKGGGGGLLGELGNIAGMPGLGAVVKLFGPAGLVWGVAKKIASVVGGTIEKLGQQIQKFVGLANPGAMKRFNFAMQDTMAVIGHTATPLVEGWTKEIKILGDFLATILPSAQDFRNEIGDLDEVFKPMKEVLAELAPTIKEGLVKIVKVWTEAFKLIWMGIKKIVDLAKDLGLIKGGGKLNDSNRAAARQASFSDPEAFAKQFYQEIFSQKGVDPNRKTAQEAEQININTRGILASMKGLGQKIARAIKDGLREMNPFKGLELPEFSNPFKGFELPALKLPELKLPEIKFPELKLPELALPEGVLSLPQDISRAVTQIPDGIKNALTNFPEQLARAIRGAIPIPRLPSLPGGGGGDNAPSPLDRAQDAIRRWILP